MFTTVYGLFCVMESSNEKNQGKTYRRDVFTTPFNSIKSNLLYLLYPIILLYYLSLHTEEERIYGVHIPNLHQAITHRISLR